jgi:peptide/nickel transport system permease protein
LSLGYLARRLLSFVVTIWATASAIFFLVHLAPGNPVQYIVTRLEQTSGGVANGAALIAHYKKVFGLDHSLGSQYWSYLVQLAHGNLGYSIEDFPEHVTSLIFHALPWTVGLLGVSIVLAWAIGTLLGGLLAWPSTPRAARPALSGLMALQAVPQYLLALLLLFVFAYKTRLLPESGAESITGQYTGLAKVGDILDHALLPGLSIALVLIGFWMMSMRSMMVSVLGSDYLLLGEAKGLRPSTVFFRYGMRTAMLPQVTSLAIWLGWVMSGSFVVEIIFGYPGLGLLFNNAISGRDYPLIEGISLMMVIMVSVALLALDLVLPLLDPRIGYEPR